MTRLALCLALGALLHGAVAARPVPPEIARSCPQVVRVFGGGSTEDTLDLLVLPDGFTEGELDLYRCSVALLFDRLLRFAPFDTVAGAVNVYRIDQSASRTGIEVDPRCPSDPHPSFDPFSDRPQRVAAVRRACEDLASRRGLARESLGRPLFAPGTFCDSCTRTDFDFFHDPEVTSDCRVLWTDADGLRRIWRLTRCAPKVDVVVVIVNSVAHAGVGTGDSHPPISVVTLADVDDAARQAELLGHELGHSLGLLDEYVSRVTPDHLPGFFTGRNVVRRVSEDGPLERAPWAEHCVPSDGKCVVFDGSSCREGLPDERPLPDVGLIEGAYYLPCGYFRAEDHCLLDHDSDYCVGCRVYLDRLFRDLGLQSDERDPGPVSAPNPAARPASPGP